MDIKALVFDFDGVITDTEPVHMEAWLAVFEPMGISFDEEEYRENYLGLNDRDFLDAVSRIHGRHFGEAERLDMIGQKSEGALSMLAHDIPLLPGVREFIDEAAKNRMLAICSGANRAEIEFILKSIKRRELFDPIIASDSVTKGKPDPEGYIRALEGLQKRATELLLPEHVLAIEDSPKGIAAARAAGIRCIAVGEAFPPSELSQAERAFKSLAEVDLNEI